MTVSEKMCIRRTNVQTISEEKGEVGVVLQGLCLLRLAVVSPGSRSIVRY